MPAKLGYLNYKIGVVYVAEPTVWAPLTSPIANFVETTPPMEWAISSFLFIQSGAELRPQSYTTLPNTEF
jgi:hypothetical protein